MKLLQDAEERRAQMIAERDVARLAAEVERARRAAEIERLAAAHGFHTGGAGGVAGGGSSASLASSNGGASLPPTPTASSGALDALAPTGLEVSPADPSYQVSPAEAVVKAMVQEASAAVKAEIQRKKRETIASGAGVGVGSPEEPGRASAGSVEAFMRQLSDLRQRCARISPARLFPRRQRLPLCAAESQLRSIPVFLLQSSRCWTPNASATNTLASPFSLHNSAPPHSRRESELSKHSAALEATIGELLQGDAQGAGAEHTRAS